jgi:hypothetical protein
MVTFFKILGTILTNPGSISMATYYNGDHQHFAIVTNSDESTTALFTGKTLPWWLKLLLPSAWNLAFPDMTFHFCKVDISNEDPDTWINKNEDKLIPPGFSSSEVYTSFAISGSTLYYCTIAQKQLDYLLQKCMHTFSPLTIAHPSQSLANHYKQYTGDSFILLSIDALSSTICLFKDNAVQSIFTLWPSYSDLKENDSESISYLKTSLEQIANGNNYKVIIRTHEPLNMAELFVNTSMLTFISPPKIPGIPDSYHEAYTLAAKRDKSLITILPEIHSQNAVNKKHIWIQTLHWLRRGIIGTSGILVLLLFVTGLVSIVQYSNKDNYAQYQQKSQIINSLLTKRHAHIVTLKSTESYLFKRSNFTHLISDLQTIFPEGMWAEEIFITGSDNHSQKIELRALSNSTGLLGSFMKLMHENKKFSNIRMVYSEQVMVKNTKVIRTKIECEWEE